MPGGAKQIRGAQYPPIMSKNQLSKFMKEGNLGDSQNGNGSQKHDCYLNYQNNENLFNILTNNHHIANANKTHTNTNTNQTENKNNNNNKKKCQSEGDISKESLKLPQLRLENSNENKTNNKNKNQKRESKKISKFASESDSQIGNNKDEIPSADIDEIIKTARTEDDNRMNNNLTNVSSTITDIIHNNNNNNNNNNKNDETKNDSKTDGITMTRITTCRKNENRTRLLKKMIDTEMLNANELRKACWRGIPPLMRPIIWKLLIGYIPKNKSRRESTLKRKRDEYYNLIERYYINVESNDRTESEIQIINQLNKDIPRTSCELKLFQIENISKLLTRALYIWSHRHTATGYVQGIDNLITPFVYIFLNEYLIFNYNIELDITDNNNNNNKKNGNHFCESREIVSKLSSKELLSIEADSYWCLDYLIEGLQLNYTDGIPGIKIMVNQLADIVKKVNINLAKHFENVKLEYMQLSFRWMNCLLMRELPFHHVIRLWDTYLCEGVELSHGFSEFHVFVCAALLLCFADELMIKDFDEIILFIQALPEKTKKWKEREIETMLSEAYVYQQLYGKTKKSIV